ncbi:hypothetical protein MKX01_002562 [Papaver californicum]|nr:hypothetical protein MKX01_002562 [Papaver californicum]
MEDYEIKEKKQAAADVLSNYSQFAMMCIGKHVRPCDLRLQLMKEISGMPTSLKRIPRQQTVSPDSALGRSASSGGTIGGHKTDGS